MMIFLIGFVMQSGNAQTDPQPASSNFNDVALSIWIPDNIEGLTPTAKQNLHNKLGQIATKNGVLAAPEGHPCVLTANVILVNKQITPSLPAKHLYELEVTLYVGNAIEGKSFASYTTNVQGVGNNDIQAYMRAIQAIRTDDPAYQSFLERGKRQMISYFNTYCEVIIKEAETLINTQQFARAFFILSTIPNECTDCWVRALEMRNDLFYKKIDTECQSLILTATGVWNNGLNTNAAIKASYVLSGINPDSECYDDALQLMENIGDRMREIDRREWDFMNKKLDAKMAVQHELISAFREIAVAWAENRPQTFINYRSYRPFW